jgi:hypothetical protein
VVVNLSTHGHRLQPIGARSLHPTEALLVSMATARGAWVRTCTCGLPIIAADEMALHRLWRRHRQAAADVANGRLG